ncbi:MAG: hypothetical protein RLZZ383_973 [Pseudomonadota bacterium]
MARGVGSVLSVVSGLAGLAWVGGGASPAALASAEPTPSAPDAGAVTAGDAARGEVLAGLAGCLLCHGAQGEGATVEVPGVGAAFAPPITHTALSAWRFSDWEAAFREGRSPRGTAYGPFFPWKALGGMTDADLMDIAAWASALPDAPWSTPTRPKGLWTWIGPAAASRFAAPSVSPLPEVGDPTVAAQLARGRYLVSTVGHCGSCHDGRTWLGRPDAAASLGGGPRALAPNITAGDPQIGALTIEGLADRLAAGEDAEGEPLVGDMAAIAAHGLARLPEADRRAIAAWLLAVPAVAVSR